MPLRFLRDLCLGFGGRLTSLYLVNCGLTELPREMCALENLEVLDIQNNNVFWVHHRLASSLGKLKDFSQHGNPRFPQQFGHMIEPMRTAWSRRNLAQLCELDANHRATQLCFMGLLRKRHGLSRDMTALLGRVLWSLRDELEHEGGRAYQE